MSRTKDRTEDKCIKLILKQWIALKVRSDWLIKLRTSFFIKFSTPKYYISSVMIGSLNSGYQFIFRVTLYKNALRQQLQSRKKLQMAKHSGFDEI